MPVSEARDHISELIGRARYAGQETILTHYGAPVAAVISIEEYQRLKHARGDSNSDSYELPPEIAAQVAEGRAHPERRVPYRRRTRPAQ
jgi:prevent-host-death family protein